jgi:hypothetical protein
LCIAQLIPFALEHDRGVVRRWILFKQFRVQRRQQGDGNMRTMMQYLFQSFNFRGKAKPYRKDHLRPGAEDNAQSWLRTPPDSTSFSTEASLSTGLRPGHHR